MYVEQSERKKWSTVYQQMCKGGNKVESVRQV